MSSSSRNAPCAGQGGRISDLSTKKDLQHWDDISDKIRFPEGTRHGSVFQVKEEILGRLLK
jgi:hypothetical protein